MNGNVLLGTDWRPSGSSASPPGVALLFPRVQQTGVQIPVNPHRGETTESVFNSLVFSDPTDTRLNPSPPTGTLDCSYPPTSVKDSSGSSVSCSLETSGCDRDSKVRKEGEGSGNYPLGPFWFFIWQKRNWGIRKGEDSQQQQQKKIIWIIKILWKSNVFSTFLLCIKSVYSVSRGVTIV